MYKLIAITKNAHDFTSFLPSSALLKCPSNTTGTSHGVTSRCSPRVQGSPSWGPVILLAPSAMASTCSSFLPGKRVFIAILPLDLSCHLAALGPQVFEGSYITCQCNYSSSRHFILTHIHKFSLVSAFPLEVVAVAASIWSIALLFAADLVRIASEVSLLSETASKI